MKKRIVSIIVVMLLLVSILSGCGLITLNAERDGAEVISTVTIDDMQGVVTKADLMGFFNQIGIMYIQYYGWSAEKVINELTTQLSNKEALVLHAMHAIGAEQKVDLNKMKADNKAYVENELLVGTNKYKKDVRPYDLFNLFTETEKVYVIRNTKDAFKESYEAVLKEVKSEIEANAPVEEDKKDEEEDKKEEDKKKELAPRTQKTYTPATGYDKTRTYDDMKYELESTFFTEMDKKQKDGKLTKAEEEAYKRFESNLVKNFDSINNAWNTLLDGQKESRLIEKYREEFVDDEKFNAVTDEINSKYNLAFVADLKKVTDEATYKTAIEADKTGDLLVHHKSKVDENGEYNKYFTVKSILLQFNEEQKAALDSIKKGILGTGTDNKKDINEAREALALKDDYTIPGYIVDEEHEAIGGIRVNRSNENYDPNAKCDVKDCPCKACVNHKDHKKGDKCDNENCTCVACVNSAYSRRSVFFEDILEEMSLALAKAGENVILPESIASDETLKAQAVLNAKMDVFDDYIYLVNDDPGMFNSNGYSMSTKGESQYVGEYVALGRELAKVGKVGTVGIAETTVPNPTDKNAADVIIHTYKAADGDPISYIVNDFGIHIIMVTAIADLDNDVVVVEDKGEDGAIVRYDLGKVLGGQNVYVTDEKGKPVIKDGKKELKEIKTITVESKLKDKIKTEKQNKAYQEHETEINKGFESKVKKEDKTISKIIKDIEKELGDLAHGHDHSGHNH